MGYFFDYLNYNNYKMEGVSFLEADRNPCPVCGHPTGDCAGDNAPTHVIGFEASQGKSTPLFHVEEEVWEEKQITPYTKARVLVYKKGENISIEEAKRLGLL
jgi:hypothetical protein